MSQGPCCALREIFRWDSFIVLLTSNSQSYLAWKCITPISASLVTWLFICFFNVFMFSSFYKDTSYVALGLTLMTSFSIWLYLQKPYSQEGHTHKYWGLEFQQILSVDTIQPITPHKVPAVLEEELIPLRCFMDFSWQADYWGFNYYTIAVTW